MRPLGAVTQMEMLRLFGDRLDDREVLAEDARANLEALGATTLLARLDEVAPLHLSVGVPS